MKTEYLNENEFEDYLLHTRHEKEELAQQSNRPTVAELLSSGFGQSLNDHSAAEEA